MLAGGVVLWYTAEQSVEFSARHAAIAVDWLTYGTVLLDATVEHSPTRVGHAAKLSATGAATTRGV